MTTDRETLANALFSLGYQIQKYWMFKIRDERTASALINKDGSIHDFGGDFHGDLPSFLKEFHGMSIREAIQEAKRLLNIPISYDFSEYEKKEQRVKQGFIDESYLKQYATHRKTHFQAYTKLLEGLMPSVKSPAKRKEIALKYEIGYQPAGSFNGKTFCDRLIMPIRNIDGKILTLWKYNPFTQKANKLRYTSGRARGTFNLMDLKSFKDNPKDLVFVCEGEKDVLNAVGNGFRAITPGSATSRFTDNELELFSGLRIVVVGDNDESGRSFNEEMLKQLKPYASSIRSLEWDSFLKNRACTQKAHKGFDLTDWLSLRQEIQ